MYFMMFRKVSLAALQSWASTDLSSGWLMGLPVHAISFSISSIFFFLRSVPDRGTANMSTLMVSVCRVVHVSCVVCRVCRVACTGDELGVEVLLREAKHREVGRGVVLGRCRTRSTRHHCFEGKEIVCIPRGQPPLDIPQMPLGGG